MRAPRYRWRRQTYARSTRLRLECDREPTTIYIDRERDGGVYVLKVSGAVVSEFATPDEAKRSALAIL